MASTPWARAHRPTCDAQGPRSPTWPLTPTAPGAAERQGSSAPPTRRVGVLVQAGRLTQAPPRPPQAVEPRWYHHEAPWGLRCWGGPGWVSTATPGPGSALPLTPLTRPLGQNLLARGPRARSLPWWAHTQHRPETKIKRLRLDGWGRRRGAAGGVVSQGIRPRRHPYL